MVVTYFPNFKPQPRNASGVKSVVYPFLICFGSNSSLRLRPLRSGRRDVHGIERRGGRDKDPVPFWAAESQIGYRFRHPYFSEANALRRITMHAITGARPNITLVIDPKTVCQAGRNLGKNFSAAYPPLSIHGERSNMM